MSRKQRESINSPMKAYRCHLNMSTNRETFDAAKFLQDDETIAAYLDMAREDRNPEMLRLAMDNVYRARDAKLAAKSIQN
jgi:DNA-binding phage protein